MELSLELTKHYGSKTECQIIQRLTTAMGCKQHIE